MSSIHLPRIGKVAAGLITICLLPALCFAQESKVVSPSSYDAEDTQELEENLFLTANVTFYSDYYYRGIPLYDDVSIQPNLSLTYDFGEAGSIGASVWMHLPGGDDQGNTDVFVTNPQTGNSELVFFQETKNKFVELDPSVYYANTFGPLSFSVGHIWYTNPHEGELADVRDANTGEVLSTIEPTPDTAEVFGSIALDVPSNPTLTVYHDYRRFEYEYYSLGFSHTLECENMGEGFNLTPYVNFGFTTNGEKAYADASGLKHINAGVRANMKWGDFRVTPIFTYVFGTDDDENGDRTPNQFLFGIDFAYDTALL